MSSWLLTLGLVAVMLVGCATPYGDGDPPETTSAITTAEPTKTETKKKAAPVEATAPKAADAVSGTKTTIAAPPASVSFSWNRVTETAAYSLDLLLKDRTTIGPCIGVTWVHHELSTTFRGECPSSDAHPTVAMSDIEGFQLCWAEDDDWTHATCTHVIWDGASSSVTFDN